MFKWTAPRKKEKNIHVPAAEAPAGNQSIGSVEFDAEICRLKTLADGGLRVELNLPELEPALFALLYALRNKAVKIKIT